MPSAWSCGATTKNEDRFHLFEIYSDSAAMGANASAPWFAEYMARAAPLLAGEPPW